MEADSNIYVVISCKTHYFQGDTEDDPRSIRTFSSVYEYKIGFSIFGDVMRHGLIVSVTAVLGQPVSPIFKVVLTHSN
jgi:hypothetical protein